MSDSGMYFLASLGVTLGLLTRTMATCYGPCLTIPSIRYGASYCDADRRVLPTILALYLELSQCQPCQLRTA
ncbi:hypothetical protein D3C85_167090 [compost metagenome]